MTVPQIVPLFPLSVVLLPGAPLPLHIFERRYRQLLADVTGADGRRAFGVVAGHLGDVPVADVGTMAEILENEPYPDGRSDLLTVGSRRFRIRSVDQDSRPYLLAEVDWLDEVDGELAPRLLERAVGLTGAYDRVLAQLGTGRAPEPLPAEPLRASYDIAARLHLPDADRQELLAAESAAHRLHREIELLQREISLVGATRAVPVPAAVLQIVPSVS